MLLTRIKCSNLDLPQAIYQDQIFAGETVSNPLQGEIAWPNTPGGDRRLGLVIDEIAAAETAPPPIHYTILTPVETLILVVILVGALMVTGTLPTILRLAGIPIGILVLLKILNRILTLAKEFTQGESKSQTGRQSRVEFPPRDSEIDQTKERLLATYEEDV